MFKIRQLYLVRALCYLNSWWKMEGYVGAYGRKKTRRAALHYSNLFSQQLIQSRERENSHEKDIHLSMGTLLPWPRHLLLGLTPPSNSASWRTNPQHEFWSFGGDKPYSNHNNHFLVHHCVSVPVSHILANNCWYLSFLIVTHLWSGILLQFVVPWWLMRLSTFSCTSMNFNLIEILHMILYYFTYL